MDEQQTPASEEEQQEPASDTEETPGQPATFELDGVSYTSEQIQEAFKSHQDKDNWSKTNTQEAQRLADERGKLEKVREIETYLNDNPEAYEKLQGVMNESYQQQQQPQEGQPNPQIQKELSSQKEELADFKAQIELRNELHDLKTNHKKEFEEKPELEREIVQFAYDNGIDNLEHAYKVMMYNQTQEKALEEGQEMGAQAQQKSKDLAMPNGAKAAPTKYKGKSDQDLVNALMDDPRELTT
jgi:hypothetical protein